MAKFNVKIELPGSGNNHYQQLNNELKKETGNGLKFLSQATTGKFQQKVDYAIEGNINIQDLGSLLSRVTTKINKASSFTILRSKGNVSI